MLTLEDYGYRISLNPRRGATINSADWCHPDRGWTPIFEPVEFVHDEYRAGCFIMAPFANRIADGRFDFQGRQYQTAVNRPEEGMAIHGYVRELPWEIEKVSKNAVRLFQRIDGPESPWLFHCWFSVILSSEGIEFELRLVNSSVRTMPYGLGFHPWFPRPFGTTLQFASSGAYARDRRFLTLSQIKSFPRISDGRTGDLDLISAFDATFEWSHPRVARINWPSRNTSLRLEGDGAMKFLQVYMPEGRDILCVEPVSHVPDAVNRPWLDAEMMMTELEPGGELSGTFRMQASPLFLD